MIITTIKLHNSHIYVYSFLLMLASYVTSNTLKAATVTDAFDILVRTITFEGIGTEEIGFGPSVNLLRLKIYDRQNNEIVAKFPGNYKIGPSLSFEGKIQYLTKSRIGLVVQSSWGTVKNYKQSSIGNNNSLEFTPQIDGVFMQINPIFFYRFGDKFHKGIRSWSSSIGAGLGITNMSLRGEAVDLSDNTNKKINVDIVNAWYAQPGVYARIRYQFWFTSYYSSLPIWGYNTNEYNYQLINSAFKVGRFFIF